ncbi:unnamed protein product [Vitrella brassicaformis CCMP3155]|uniref:Uncharacterized protein n=3 Tax=Vitrella brassicaformis TaxID=1169539 RepID=A0A0G4E9J2_VITBC|nr:unnamed protein product [Vitrella brassicaformis CCMP3155]|eukprot:CEL92272.1 unnamed protein product [Vitrella brassicaformis CCMP3155]
MLPQWELANLPSYGKCLLVFPEGTSGITRQLACAVVQSDVDDDTIGRLIDQGADLSVVIHIIQLYGGRGYEYQKGLLDAVPFAHSRSPIASRIVIRLIKQGASVTDASLEDFVRKSPLHVAQRIVAFSRPNAFLASFRPTGRLYWPDEDERPLVTLPDGSSPQTKRLAVGLSNGTIEAQDADKLIGQGADAKTIVAFPPSRYSFPQHPLSLSLISLALRCSGRISADVLSVLVKHGADIDHGHPIVEAVEKRKWELCQSLLSFKPSLTGLTLLHKIAGHSLNETTGALVLSLVQTMIEMDSSILNEKNEYGRKPLHVFCGDPLANASLQQQLLAILVNTAGRESLLEPDEPDDDEKGWRPFHYAVSSLCMTMVDWLFKQDPHVIHHINETISTDPERTILGHLTREAVDEWDSFLPPERHAPKSLMMMRRLLKWGASVSLASGPDGFDEDETREARFLKTAYGVHLSIDLPDNILHCINDVLRPTRSILASLTQCIPLTANKTLRLPSDTIHHISGFLTSWWVPRIGEDHFRTEIQGIVHHFVSSAHKIVLSGGSNRAVARDHVRLFCIRGQHMGLREVLDACIREEGQRWGVATRFPGLPTFTESLRRLPALPQRDFEAIERMKVLQEVAGACELRNAELRLEVDRLQHELRAVKEELMRWVLSRAGGLEGGGLATH